MNADTVRVESNAEFSQIIKRCLIRELYRKQKITQSQFERLMQLQRSR